MAESVQLNPVSEVPITSTATSRRFGWLAAIVAIALILGAFSTSEWVGARGLDYIEHGTQLKRHQNILEGATTSHWQYRVLTAYVLEAVIKVLAQLHVPHHVAVAFIGFRIFEDTLLLILAYLYFRKLGIPLLNAIVGMALLAYGMSYSHYDSDLSFNTFLDVIFYLLAGLCVLHGRFVWILPITFFAALNRETCGLIPFLLLVPMLVRPRDLLRKALWFLVASGAIYLAVFVALRLLYGYRPGSSAYGHHSGTIEMVIFNLLRPLTWQRLLATLSIVPVLAMIGYRKWPVQLRGFFWVLVPVWFIVHFVAPIAAESRFFLVPHALVFVPGALLSLTRLAPAPGRVLAPAR